jgi:hypothetical protein
MQKVEGSSPFIRFTEPAGNGRVFFWKGPETERERARLASGHVSGTHLDMAHRLGGWLGAHALDGLGSQGQSDVICSFLRAIGSSAESTRRQRRLTSSLTAPRAGSHCQKCEKWCRRKAGGIEEVRWKFAPRTRFGSKGAWIRT